jgi:hypothetical protein
LLVISRFAEQVRTDYKRAARFATTILHYKPSTISTSTLSKPTPSIKMSRLFTPLLLLTSALLAHAGVSQKDFTGLGHIYVLESEDWAKATPNDTVGCLNDAGKLVVGKTDKHCGVFSRLDDYPWTLSSKKGNCTFEDTTQETNKDSKYGGNDYAWSCTELHESEIYDELYTIVSIFSCSIPANMLTQARTASHTSFSASVM